MATSEEKQELVETLKGPRYYRIMIWGYGGESAYIPLNEPQYNFWKPIIDEHGDSDAVTYMTGAEDGNWEFEDIDSVPENADFMKDSNGDYRPWYEHHNELEHQWGVDFDNSNITIEEVDSNEYNAKVIATIVDGKSLSEWTDSIEKADNYETEITNRSISEYEDWTEPHILQFYSAEKGTFFDGRIETYGELDPKKFMFHSLEYAKGDDTVTQIFYDGKELDNDGGDTNGKGYSVHLWKN